MATASLARTPQKATPLPAPSCRDGATRNRCWCDKNPDLAYRPDPGYNVVYVSKRPRTAAGGRAPFWPVTRRYHACHERRTGERTTTLGTADVPMAIGVKVKVTSATARTRPRPGYSGSPPAEDRWAADVPQAGLWQTAGCRGRSFRSSPSCGRAALAGTTTHGGTK